MEASVRTWSSSIQFLISVTIAVSSGGAAAAATPPHVPLETYSHPQSLVRIDGSRRINLFCAGEGKPTVIFEAGLGNSNMVWLEVQPQVARFTRACSYDRAGFGFSDPPRQSVDARNAVDDLHRLITAANISSPVVLVGHSLGGLFNILYSATYPDEVAGMVLVDPSIPGLETEQWETPQIAAMSFHYEASRLLEVRRCLNIARKIESGKPATGDSECLNVPSGLDPITQHELRREAADPGHQAALLSTMECFFIPSPGHRSLDDEELMAKPFVFGSKPLVVLTAGQKDFLSQATPSQTAAFRSAWKLGHDAIAAASKVGVNVVVAQSGHYIETEQPEIVTKYILDVVHEIHAARP